MGSTRGRTVGGFRLGAKVRTGPVLAVFESEDDLGRRVEVACYKASGLAGRMTFEDFREEARRTGTVEHESLCPLVTVGEEGDLWFAVARVPDDPTLRDLLERGGAIAPERARMVAEGIAGALARLHESGVRHGDLRPETILLSRGRAVLSPRRLVPMAAKDRDARYLAPEEIRGGDGDIRSDLFSLGAVLLETLTGEPAAKNRSPQAALAAAREGPPDWLSQIAPELATIIASLYTVSPDDRPANPATVTRALSGEIRVAGSEAPPAPPPAPAPAAPVRAAAPAAAPARAATPMLPKKRLLGRLAMPTAGGRSIWDLVDDETYLSLTRKGSVSISSQPGRGDLAVIEREEAADVLSAVPEREPHVRVNGSLVDRHELNEGDRIRVGEHEVGYEGVRTDARSGPAPRARREKRRAGIVALATTLLCLLVVAWAGWSIYEAYGVGEDVFRAAAEAEARLAGAEEGPAEFSPISPEHREAARKAFEQAKAFAEERPDAFEAARKRFKEVQDLYGETEFGYLAYREMERLEQRRSAALAAAYDEVVKNAGLAIEEGRLYDAYLLYLNFSVDYEGTDLSPRAEREAESIEEALAARFDDDMARAESAIKAKEYGTALDILKSVEGYASPELAARAARRMEQVRGALTETQVPDAENPAEPPPEPVTPPETPPEPGPPEPAPPDGEESRLEKRAADLLEGAARAIEKERWDVALKALGSLADERYRDTRVVAENRAEIERMTDLARISRDGAAGLFKGQVKVLRDREVVLTYHFQAPADEEDWRFLNPFADPGSALFERRREGYYARGVGALVHDAVFEPQSLRVRARIQAIKPTDFGVQFFEPEEMLRYYLFTVQNRYFTIGAERTPLHENVIWIFGGGAWADNPDGDIGFVRVAKSPKPGVSAGETISLDAAKTGNGVTMSIKNSPPLRGSALGDDRYVYPALRPALYVLKSEAVFEEVEIQGVLQKAWADQAVARALKKLGR